MLLGCCYIVIYALRSWRISIANCLEVLSVGLMAGGAALSISGLLGFLFGVPHTRDESQSPAESKAKDGEPKNLRAVGSGTTYRPNTGLEQISDWLTKMLVGVGLVEIKVIPSKLVRLAAYVAMGLGNNDQAQVFAMALLAYFGLGGFVFGFLWARLYLPKWFREADKVEQLEEKVSSLEAKLIANAKAIALASHQIKEISEGPAESEQSLADAFRAASPEAREEVFIIAQQSYDEERKRNGTTELEILARRIVPVVRGLIANDPNEREHRYHSLLAQLLRRIPGNADAVEEEITKAIEIRDILKKRGWKWYEFQRARCLIENDADLEKHNRSGERQIAKIRADLREAFNDKNWQGWYGDHKVVQEWMRLNLEISDGKQSP